MDLSSSAKTWLSFRSADANFHTLHDFPFHFRGCPLNALL